MDEFLEGEKTVSKKVKLSWLWLYKNQYILSLCKPYQNWPKQWMTMRRSSWENHQLTWKIKISLFSQIHLHSQFSIKLNIYLSPTESKIMKINLSKGVRMNIQTKKSRKTGWSNNSQINPRNKKWNDKKIRKRTKASINRPYRKRRINNQLC